MRAEVVAFRRIIRECSFLFPPIMSRRWSDIRRTDSKCRSTDFLLQILRKSAESFQNFVDRLIVHKDNLLPGHNRNLGLRILFSWETSAVAAARLHTFCSRLMTPHKRYDRAWSAAERPSGLTSNPSVPGSNPGAGGIRMMA